jgi:hypothetical protein
MHPISRTALVACLAVLPVSAQLFEESSDLSLPLNAQGKTARMLNVTFQPSGAIGSFIGAGFAQLRNDPEEWGQGFKGFSHRFASLYGRRATANTIALGLDVAMKTDPRYDRCECKSFKPRLGHAILRTFRTRKDSGGEVVNVPLLTGYFGAAAIANQWNPDRLKTGGEIVQTATIDIGFGAGLNVIREFWPDVRKRILFFKR